MRRDERGFVLAAVGAVLLLLAALAAGAFFAALQEQRLGAGTQAAVRALLAADAGAAAVLGDWGPAQTGALLPGDTLALAPALPPGAGRATVVVAAWGERLLLVRAHGTDATGRAARDVALLARLRLPPLATPAALVAVESIAPAVAARASGADAVPAGWTCAEPGRSIAPVLVPWPLPWSDWDSLAAAAYVGARLPDAAHPVVRVPGDFDIIGGNGTGILLVEGDASLAGDAKLTGVLLVRGRLELRGTGGQVTGAVRARVVVAEPSALAGDYPFKWSSCAVLRARRAVAAGVGLRGWSWGDPSGGW